jgi:hypothetical protein
MRAGNVRIVLRQKDIQPLPALASVYRKTYFFRLSNQIVTPVFCHSREGGNPVSLFFWMPDNVRHDNQCVIAKRFSGHDDLYVTLWQSILFFITQCY